MAKRCWVEESPKVPVVARIVERLKMQRFCNEKVPDNNKILSYIKQADKILPAFQPPQQLFKHKTIISLGVDPMTVLGKASQSDNVS